MSSTPTPGGIREVEGKENSLEVVDLARFAVEEHNKKENAMLQYVKVVDAKQQVVAGTVRSRNLSPPILPPAKLALSFRFQGDRRYV
ncbi:hypothetical protein NL676_004562 [Syzygium grande]|nr:hypothetical protein NL676_004562 [Syzygium grande]